jgi:hypothetical protein
MIFGCLGKPTEMGLAIVAASMALVFSDIDKFQSFNGAGFSAVLRNQIEAIIDKQTEPISGNDSENTSPLTAKLESEVKSVLGALNHSRFTWRYLAGVSQDSKQPKAKAKKALDWLVSNGFARQSQGKHGPIWSITDEGRSKDVIDDFDAAIDS